MWQNAIAFTRTGQGTLAVGLGNILRKSEDADLAHRSAQLIRYLSDRGVDVSITLKDVWKRSVLQSVALFAILFALPGAALALMFAPWDTAPSVSSPSLVQAATPAPTDASADQRFDDAFGAKAASASVPKPEPVPTCSAPPGNGSILADYRGEIAKGHVLKIDNGSQGDAIIKLRDASTDKTIASFFVQSGQAASLTRIPDGTYRIQYAFGDDLKPDCKTFVDLDSAGEFPDAETLKTEYHEEYDRTEVITDSLSYTLYEVPGGNVHPETISAADFDKP